MSRLPAFSRNPINCKRNFKRQKCQQKKDPANLNQVFCNQLLASFLRSSFLISLRIFMTKIAYSVKYSLYLNQIYRCQYTTVVSCWLNASHLDLGPWKCFLKSFSANRKKYVYISKKIEKLKNLKFGVPQAISFGSASIHLIYTWYRKSDSPRQISNMLLYMNNTIMKTIFLLDF